MYPNGYYKFAQFPINLMSKLNLTLWIALMKDPFKYKKADLSLLCRTTATWFQP